MDYFYIWKNSGFWDISQNALGQSDCKIFKSPISLEKNDEKNWFFACWYKFIEVKRWLENIGVGMVINGCDHSGSRTLNLAVSHEEINETGFWCADMNSGKLEVTLISAPPPNEGFCKITFACLSAHPSVCSLVLHFSQERLISFFWFLPQW